MNKETDNNLYPTLSSAINNFGFDRAPFIEGFKREHFTLQQKAVSTIVLPMIAVMAESYETNYYDDRNGMAAEMCKFIKDALAEKYGYDVVSHSLSFV